MASPATVSRCGMVYIDPDELKWMPYVQTWLSGLGAKVMHISITIIYYTIINKIINIVVNQAFHGHILSCGRRVKHQTHFPII